MFDSPLADGARALAVALGIGLLLGAERERRMSREGRRGFAGLRTFALVALLGGIAARTGGTPIVAVGLAIIGAASIGAYVTSDREDAGITSEVALVVAFLLGVLSQEDARLASAVAVTVTCSVCEAPGTNVPSAHETVPADSVHGGSAETKLVPPGSGSLTATAAASDTPLFVTTSV